MVGGKVIGLSRRPDSTLLNVQDKRDNCCVRVIEKKISNGEQVSIKLGDDVWWQCGKVMWTPAGEYRPGADQKCGVDFDIHLPKVGYSH